MEDGKYEFCVIHSQYPQQTHRGPMTEQEAYDWVREAIEDGFRPDYFYVAHRKVGPWVKS